MRRITKQKIVLYVIIGLIAIGLLSRIARNPSAAIIPILVFGGVFLLYKYPPHRWRTMFEQARYGGNDRNPRHKGRTKKAKFRVIPGTKRDDEDDLPKYH